MIIMSYGGGGGGGDNSVHRRHETLAGENIIMGGERDGGMEEWRNGGVCG